MLSHFYKNHVLLKRKACSSVLDGNTYRVYWEGLVFARGIPSGNASVKKFIKGVERVGIESACGLLKGIYFVVVERKSNGEIFAFVDNAGLYQAFYSDNLVSNSFLELVKCKGYKASDLEEQEVVEFLYFGNNFSNRTLFRDAKRISKDKIIHFTIRDTGIRVLHKSLPHINEMPENGASSLIEIFEDLAISLSNQRVSIDLTGGSDSRLIALLLDSLGLDFETAVSGGAPDYTDIAISKQVADELGHPWFRTLHSISTLEDDIPELFRATDGLYDLLHFHRQFQLQQDRLRRGIDTMISGVGGEFFKDTWWLQDFPFYHKRSANISRLVDLRMMTFKPLDMLLTGRFSEISRNLRSKIINEFSRYCLETNTETYDNIFFNFKMREAAGRELTNHSRYLKTYAPFLDLDVVRIGFNLPRQTRFFNRFHRMEITRINPLIAKIPTTEGGMTVSCEMKNYILDGPKYANNRVRRLLLKLKRRNKSFTKLIHPKFYDCVRGMTIMKHAIEMLKDFEVLDGSASLNEIADRNLGMLLSLAMLIDYLNGTGRQ